MTRCVKLNFGEGTQIVVPDSVNLITPYVLIEQQDWFEDEIRFLRRLLQSGQKVIDIGANYGVFTLSMATTVGSSGHVWAFEPASNTASILSASITANSFAQVTLEQNALSSSCGVAQLTLSAHSELNSLAHDPTSNATTERVALTTLDVAMARHNWRDIEFVKIDAEGEESNILRGGARFLSEFSPLIQYEIKAGAKLNLALVEEFAALGYQSFRLLPGFDLLIPFETASSHDPYLLNLFCCKQDRLEMLADKGLLLRSTTHQLPTDLPELTRYFDAQSRHQYRWRNTLATLPYGALLNASWKATAAQLSRNEVDIALALYALSGDVSASPLERFAALQHSFALLENLCKRDASCMRLASLARVARDYGARSVAVMALAKLVMMIEAGERIDTSEPFLPPEARFDNIPPNEAIDAWVEAAVLEAAERLRSYSSFYTGESSRKHLLRIKALGFGSAEMDRRLRLLEMRFNRPA